MKANQRFVRPHFTPSKTNTPSKWNKFIEFISLHRNEINSLNLFYLFLFDGVFVGPTSEVSCILTRPKKASIIIIQSYSRPAWYGKCAEEHETHSTCKNTTIRSIPLWRIPSRIAQRPSMICKRDRKTKAAESHHPSDLRMAENNYPRILQQNLRNHGECTATTWT